MQPVSVGPEGASPLSSPWTVRSRDWFAPWRHTVHLGCTVSQMPSSQQMGIS